MRYVVLEVNNDAGSGDDDYGVIGIYRCTIDAPDVEAASLELLSCLDPEMELGPMDLHDGDDRPFIGNDDYKFYFIQETSNYNM